MAWQDSLDSISGTREHCVAWKRHRTLPDGCDEMRVNFRTALLAATREAQGVRPLARGEKWFRRPRRERNAPGRRNCREMSSAAPGTLGNAQGDCAIEWLLLKCLVGAANGTHACQELASKKNLDVLPRSAPYPKSFFVVRVGEQAPIVQHMLLVLVLLLLFVCSPAKRPNGPRPLASTIQSCQTGTARTSPSNGLASRGRSSSNGGPHCVGRGPNGWMDGPRCWQWGDNGCRGCLQHTGSQRAVA
ncbi:MAG: hypothetical protein Q9159_002144 [Coniocarpon cinnabarinum]